LIFKESKKLQELNILFFIKAINIHIKVNILFRIMNNKNKKFSLSVLVYDLDLKAHFSFDIAVSSMCIFL